MAKVQLTRFVSFSFALPTDANFPKKNPPKKQGTTGATPAAENAEPPTPSTPITPRHPDSFNKNGNAANAQQPPNAAANPPQPAQQPAPQAPPTMSVPAPPTIDFDINPDFGFNLGDDMSGGGINLDFATGLDTSDVLDNFDFDSLLNTDGGLPFEG